MSFFGIFGNKSQPSYQDLKNQQAQRGRCGAALDKWGTEVRTWRRDPEVLADAQEKCSPYMDDMEVKYFNNEGNLDGYRASGEAIREQMEEMYPDEVKHDREAFMEAWGPSFEKMNEGREARSRARMRGPSTPQTDETKTDNTTRTRRYDVEKAKRRDERFKEAARLIQP